MTFMSWACPAQITINGDRKPEIVQRIVLNGDTQDATNTILLDFYGQLYDATGYKRPVALHGFPPSRPTGSH